MKSSKLFNVVVQRVLFCRRLCAWYQKHSRILPWRESRDPYRVWISEVMLQQTTVAAAVGFYEDWFLKFPNLESVARAPLSRVLKAWQGLGYYARARNIHRAAKIFVRDFGSRIPSDKEKLRAIPGFGPYTTGAVLSIAFGKREPIIDANIRRVFMRLLALRGFSKNRQDGPIRKILEEVLPFKNLNIFNQALMELGALVCLPRKALCAECPVCDFCKARKAGLVAVIPKIEKSKTQKIEAVLALIQHNGRYFIQRRPSEGLWADFWEFPGGKMKAAETQLGALARELAEELGTRLLAARKIMDLRHAYTRFQVRLHVWQCEIDPYPAKGKLRRWVSLKEMKKFPMPSANVKIIRHLERNII